MVPDTASRSLLIETNKQKWNWSLWCRSAIIKSHIMQHETTKFPFKSNTLAAILDANGQAIIPKVLHSLWREDHVVEHSSVFKRWSGGFCFKENKKGNGVKWLKNELTGRCDRDIHWYFNIQQFIKKMAHAAFLTSTDVCHTMETFGSASSSFMACFFKFKLHFP